MSERYIESPHVSHTSENTIFLAGGITNCPDWQRPVKDRLLAETDLVIFNPRRENWNMDSQDKASIAQIVWEHTHLKMAETILFWFPKETLCPITLFELGKYMMTEKSLYVGTHPEYQRRLDVETQMNLESENPRFIYNDLEVMISDIIADKVT